jgi:O-glycosyl hydrolase
MARDSLAQRLVLLAAALAILPHMAILSQPAFCGPPPEDADSTPEEAEAPQLPRVKVDWKQTRQTIVGFGGTMGWIHPHPLQRGEVFDLLFTKLGASVLRIRALGAEGDDEKCLEPANDNGDPLTFDWSKFPIKQTEAKNAIIIKAALERGVKTIVPVTWSPPGWMKTTGRRKGGGTLEEKRLREYAELWAAYVMGMRTQFDIDIKTISIQNEPDLQYYYPTCSIPPELYAKAVKEVEGRFKKERLDVRVLGPDTCRIYNMPEYVKAMEAAKASPGTPILTHLYDLKIPYEKVQKDPERWRKARAFAMNVKRPLWLMETANYLSFGSKPASYDEAMIWAQKIHWALVAGSCEVVCYWSLFFDKPGEALIYCAKSEDEKYEVTPKFYTSMNYFRFVRPGMVRCAAGCEDQGVLVSAFRDPKEPEMRAMVLVNPKTATVNIRLMDQVGGPWSRYLTTEKSKCAEEGNVQKGAALLLPPRSVTTLVPGAGSDLNN